MNVEETKRTTLLGEVNEVLRYAQGLCSNIKGCLCVPQKDTGPGEVKGLLPNPLDEAIARLQETRAVLAELSDFFTVEFSNKIK